jgi:hypothetical protein
MDCLVSRRFDTKIANEGIVVGQFNPGHLETVDVDFGTMKNIIKLSARRTTGMGGMAIAVGIYKTGSSQKELQLTVTPENIEISGNDDRFVNILNHRMQILQLVLPMAEFQ